MLLDIVVLVLILGYSAWLLVRAARRRRAGQPGGCCGGCCGCCGHSCSAKQTEHPRG